MHASRGPGGHAWAKFSLDDRVVIVGTAPDSAVNSLICSRFNLGLNGVDSDYGETKGKGFWTPFPCPKCHAEMTGVLKTEPTPQGEILRRRRCRLCTYTFVTSEQIRRGR